MKISKRRGSKVGKGGKKFKNNHPHNRPLKQ